MKSTINPEKSGSTLRSDNQQLTIRFCIFLFVACFLGCSISDRISYQNLAYIYKKNFTVLHPEFVVYHFSDDSSRLYFKINKAELLFVSKESQEKISSLRLSYKLLKSFDESIKSGILDSASFVFRDTMNTHSVLTHQINFKAKVGEHYLLEVKMIDVNRKQENRFFVNIDKSNKQSRQFFLLQTKDSNQVLFHHYLSSDDEISVTYDAFASTLFLHYFNKKFPIAYPPFAISNLKAFDYGADSSFVLSSANKTFSARFENEGFYHIQADTVNKVGLTLFRFHNDFPALTSAEQLIQPLCYLTAKKEYETLMNSANKKQAVDKFWLSLGGNFERSRELIRKFYNRVQEANINFTSYLEGWKTDRGMIYIVYGAPNVVYKTSNSESWVYGDANSMASINFTFVKIRNPFTDNDYNLNRSPIYENSWYNAVDMWRQGRVFNFNE